MRRRVSFVWGVAGFVALASVATAQASGKGHPNFSGKWAMDAAHSSGQMLPKSLDLVVTQDENSLKVDRTSATPQGPTTSSTTYRLDGTPATNTVTANNMTVNFTSKTAWENGSLVITTTSDMRGGLRQVERWTLSPDGKQLTIKGDIAVSGQSASNSVVLTKQ